MRICVIFNPAARGNKARHFRRHCVEHARQCEFKATSAPGEARHLACEAVINGFETIVAAGGDGTVNEVLNGLGDAPDGFQRARLAVLPLGTINVLARELRIPLQIDAAWRVVSSGREIQIDLGRADYFEEGRSQRRFFVQLGGVGLDARAIELLSWQLKKQAGPTAYVVAGLQAFMEKQPQITVRAGNKALTGELALLGNGKFYGGAFHVFPEATLDDGRLHACVFPRMNLWALLRLIPGFLLRKRFPEAMIGRLQGDKLEITSNLRAGFELDGERIGNLPATFSVDRQRLRIVVPECP